MVMSYSLFCRLSPRLSRLNFLGKEFLGLLLFEEPAYLSRTEHMIHVIYNEDNIYIYILLEHYEIF